jgi:2-dehydro-3-deoxyphosphogluconate aldolase/(4S)-4-hydroxy-2-oxoglutarate aldolase
MHSKPEKIASLIDPGVIAVVRLKSPEQILPLVEALVAGGITAVEITMTTPNALAAIREANREFGRHALIGCGTVLDGQTCRQAIEAGAQFVVSPINRSELVKVAHAAGCPLMLGAYTPTEAQSAHEAGADFVKIFPADGLGPQYIKALLAPLPHLRIVPTGGVTLANVGDFLKAGCAAVGVGSSLINERSARGAHWKDLTTLAGRFVEAARDAARAG